MERGEGRGEAVEREERKGGGGGKGHLIFSLPPTSAVCSVDVNFTDFTFTMNSDLPFIVDVGGGESQADVFS